MMFESQQQQQQKGTPGITQDTGHRTCSTHSRQKPSTTSSKRNTYKKKKGNWVGEASLSVIWYAWHCLSPLIVLIVLAHNHNKWLLHFTPNIDGATERTNGPRRVERVVRLVRRARENRAEPTEQAAEIVEQLWPAREGVEWGGNVVRSYPSGLYISKCNMQ